MYRSTRTGTTCRSTHDDVCAYIYNMCAYMYQFVGIPTVHRLAHVHVHVHVGLDLSLARERVVHVVVALVPWESGGGGEEGIRTRKSTLAII